ncbi:pyridoxal phosphate synthase yaaE subunit [Terriglobus roseus DSM 18391]|uniref:Pyridoxal 5'-phosphate synthase subunit PdxT n=1 Tax=Terriglobus roseus (strain DSM 18391 / NRRL B-41598 / KBS 63) TaxID=926566 RepID=I3ZH72_TERRK|nr:pyridoxal 5'-phosphate synthase glutaminase subunit PdxT [Terriglobus roseus]AFL88249.1 pyridoxal phosphate synthase yaaE subunit [Terriglobus roseus DSM 18391]AFL88590.1 pyridoxal phosphate synthase yaaE subunit [Terriglobus roseus DSM 18391]
MADSSTGIAQPTIGILALQGAFDAHARMLQSLGATTVLVRKPEQLATIDGLIIPGGESTTFLKHLERAGFFDVLAEFTRTKPTFGTCAGVILMAKTVLSPTQKSLGVLDIAIERNAYGRQNDSRILEAETSLPGGPIEMVYIRAPRITEMGPGVEVLAEREGSPTLVRQGHLLAATFHPELSTDPRVHQLFLDLVKSGRN